NIHPYSALHFFQDFWFPVLRYGFDYTWGNINIPFAYVVVGLTLSYLIRKFLIKRKLTETIHSYKVQWSGLVIRFLFFVSLFFWLWGFHYYQQGMMERMESQERQVNARYLSEEIYRVAGQLNHLRTTLSSDEVNESSEIRSEERRVGKECIVRCMRCR